MAPPVPDPLAEYLHLWRSLLSRSSAVDRVRLLDEDVRRRSQRSRFLFELRVRNLFQSRSPVSRKVIRKIIGFVAQDDPHSLVPACALVSRLWSSHARYYPKIIFLALSISTSLNITHTIIDFVARDDRDSLLACALVSRQWNSRATYHLKIMFYHWSPISRLPTELIHNIIDLVARDDPDSLPRCALVSRRWNSPATYHLRNLVVKPCRHPRITTTPELRAFHDVTAKDGYLTQYPKSLDISPDPEASSTYIPFLDLSSRALPNVNHLILGEGLRWTDYPPRYNNGVVGSAFHFVTILDLHCRFRSSHSLFCAVRSFRNLEEVRLRHPDPFPPIQHTPTSRNAPHGALVPSPVRLRKPLRSLEVPLLILPSVLEAFGDDVVNLSIRCPPLSALWGKDVYKPIIFQSSFLALETVELTVPTEPSNPTNHGLRRLDPLVISPIRKQGVRYSIYSLPHCNHNTAGYRREVVSKSTKLQTIQMLAGRPRWSACEMCYEHRESPAPPMQRQPPEPAVWPDEGMASSDEEWMPAVWSISSFPSNATRRDGLHNIPTTGRERLNHMGRA